MTTTLVRCTLALVAAMAFSSCISDSEKAERFYAAGTPPATPLDFLVTVKRIAEAGLDGQGSFYTEAHQRQLFGEQAKIEITHYDAAVRVIVTSFPEVGQRPPASYAAGILMDAMEEARTSGPSCRIFVELVNVMQELSFKNVVDALGPDWQEDKDAELQDYLAVTREIFNPPYPAPTGYMGNAIITYKTRKRTLQLRFNPDGLFFRGESFCN